MVKMGTFMLHMSHHLYHDEKLNAKPLAQCPAQGRHAIKD